MNDEVIQWFWKCVRSWPPERKSRLLQFATGTSRIPVNGFKDLQGSDGPRRFTIEKSGDPSQLPKSHTCFNRIDLPPYKDYASLEQKLTLAVEYVHIVSYRHWKLNVILEKLSALAKSNIHSFVFIIMHTTPNLVYRISIFIICHPFDIVLPLFLHCTYRFSFKYIYQILNKHLSLDISNTGRNPTSSSSFFKCKCNINIYRNKLFI